MGFLTAFLAKPANIAFIVLLVLLGVTGASSLYFYNKNVALHENIATIKRDNQVYVEVHNQQIASLTSVITAQNASIDAFKKTGDKQVQEMSKVQVTVNDMRTTAERQLAELRKRDVANLTCDQSIQFLEEQSKVLKWGVVK